MAIMAAILDFRSEQFKLFRSYKSPQCFLWSFKSPLHLGGKFKIDFQDGHLGFPSGMIFAIFDLQSHWYVLPKKLWVYDTSSKDSWSKDVLVNMTYGRLGQMADTTLRLIIT